MTWATATTRRHKVVQQRCTVAQTTAQKRKQNHANTRAHQKTSSQHNKKYCIVCQSTHQHTQRTLHNGRNVLFSSTVLQPTLPRTIKGNTSLALPKMLTQKQCARAQRTSSIHMADRRQGTQIVGVESAEKKRTHIKFALPTMCEHKTRPTWHRPHLKQSNCASPYGVARRNFLRNLTDLICPMTMFPHDMANHYSKHKS